MSEYYDYMIDTFGVGTNDHILVCGKCGAEASTKTIGDEIYDWCEDCGCIEGLDNELI